jgi:hypothetical protein
MQHDIGDFFVPPLGDQAIAGFEDQVKAAPRKADGGNVAIGAQRSGQDVLDAAPVDIRFEAIVRQIVAAHHRIDGRKSGLAGEEDDPRVEIAQHFANRLGQPQAGVLGFHDDIGQDHREFRSSGQNAGRGGHAEGLGQLDRPVEEDRVFQGKGEGVLEIDVVIDGEDAPGAEPGAVGEVSSENSSNSSSLSRMGCL